jgi:hypothetical protein
LVGEVSLPPAGTFSMELDGEQYGSVEQFEKARPLGGKDGASVYSLDSINKAQQTYSNPSATRSILSEKDWSPSSYVS